MIPDNRNMGGPPPNWAAPQQANAMQQPAGPMNPMQAMQAAAQGQLNPAIQVTPQFTPPAQSRDPFSFGGQRTQQGGMALPDPMEQAREQFLAARDKFQPIREEYSSAEGDERQALRPDYMEARGQFRPVRDWYRNLTDQPPGQAAGMAAMGRPRQFAPPQLAPTMALPPIAGLSQNSTMADLIARLQEQTAGNISQPDETGGVMRNTFSTPSTRETRGPFDSILGMKLVGGR